MSVSGNVESKSRAGTGIKVNGVWYNGDKTLLDGIEWKDNVTFEHDAKKKITSIEAAGGSAAPTNAPKGNTFDKRQEVIVFQSARNAAITLVNDLVTAGIVVLPSKKEEKHDAYLALVAEHTVTFNNSAMAVYTGADAEEAV